MQDSIHAHNVLDFIQELEQPMRHDFLIEGMHHAFGIDARFHACSIKNASAEELIENFIEQGKLNQDEDGLHFVGCGCNCQ